MRVVKWATRAGRNLIAPVDIPTLPKKAKGTKKLDEHDQKGNGRPLWLTPRAREALEAGAPLHGRIFSGFSCLKTFRAAARPIVGNARANYSTLRDLRHQCLTDIAEREGLVVRTS